MGLKSNFGLVVGRAGSAHTGCIHMSVSVKTPTRARRTRMISRVVVQHTLLAIFAFTLAACATVDATTKQDIGAPRFPPSDPARVQILRAEPPRAHDRLGDIVVDASTDPAPPIEKIEAKLRDEASKLGADAVVVVYDRVQPTAAYVSGPLWDRSIQAVTGRKVVGVAIKYRP